MYKDYKAYRTWVYSNKVYNQIKDEVDPENLERVISEKAATDIKFDANKAFRKDPPSQETDYFRTEFYAKAYAMR